MQKHVNIEDEIRYAYLDYAMSVIIGRAIPDVRDGLKPVHRRILYAMHELNNDYNKPYKKSARIVGDVIGKYHPHGDAAVYDALVRMAQPFSMRSPLVDGQGNFGSIDGDPPAAMRYTEVRMARLAHEFLQDIDKDTVDFQPNYDNSILEPSVLPSRVPNLLLNGASGIAVGMATNIPPHNLRELCQALQALVDDPDLTVRELMRYVPGPDFPTAAFIHGHQGIREAYETGKGIIKMRARVSIEDTSGGRRQQMIVTELPYQVNKARLLEKIAELVKDKRLGGIHEIRDESDREGMRIVLELKSGAEPKVLENQLYKFTQLEMTFGVIMLAVVGKRPEVMNLKDLLGNFLEFRRTIIVKRTRYELQQAEKRAHLLEGLKVALDHLDAVIALIRAAHSPAAAKQQLMAQHELSDLQAQAILEMRLQRLTSLERDKILADYREVLAQIEHHRKVLDSPLLVSDIIRRELQELIDGYGDPRRTEIIPESGELTERDLIADESVVVTISKAGYIKRKPTTFYRSQRRGGKGRTGMGTREKDLVTTIFTASNHDYLLVFTNRGRVYWLKVHEIPELGPTSVGKAIVNLIALESEERIATILPVKGFQEGLYAVTATKRGLVKKTGLMDYSKPRQGGIWGTLIEEGDELIAARITDGRQQLFLMSRAGKCIRVEEEKIRPMGRVSRGVRGMDVGGSELVGMDIIDSDRSILVVTERGYGKRTANAQYRIQGRGGKGVINLRVTDRNGPVVGFCQVNDDDQVILITDKGRLIRINVAEINPKGRFAQGVKLMDLEPDEKVVDVTVVVEPEEGDEEEGPA